MTLRIIDGGKNKNRPLPRMGTATYLEPSGEPGVRTTIRLEPHGAEKDSFIPIIPPIPYQGYYLNPCYFVPDPTLEEGNYLVLCEPRPSEDYQPIPNTRELLRTAHGKAGGGEETLDERGWKWAFRQNISLRNENTAEVLEKFMGACLDTGIYIHSVSNCFFVIGERDLPPEVDQDLANPLIMGDHLILARHLLRKIAEREGCIADMRSLRAGVFAEEPDLKMLESVDDEEGKPKTSRIPVFHKGSFHFPGVWIQRPPQNNPYLLAQEILTEFLQIEEHE